MKKQLLVLALLALLALLMNSCKVVEPCPAYGNGSINTVAVDNSL